MALLTQSEAVAFNGFLASVDFTDVLEWTSVAGGTDNIDIPPPPERGKEAILAKAAKDLISLEPNLHTSEADHLSRQHTGSSSAAAQSWPSLPGEQQQDHHQRRTRSYTYGFGAPSTRQSHRLHLPNHNPPGGPTQPISESIFHYPRSQSPQSNSSSSSPFGLNTPTGAEAANYPSQTARPSPHAAASAPSAFFSNPPRSSSSKRSLPADGNSWHGSSSLSVEEPTTSKRRRPSAASQPPSTLEETQSLRTRGTTRPSSSSSSTVAGSPSSVSKDAETATIAGGHPGSSAAGSASKATLLSPSQKRANHIQSEQKRRANIRKGYEALCEAVPALREAIKQEEEAARAADEASGRNKRKRKAKGPAAEDANADKGLDGRAGPKSENVVLQKTIDHLRGLLAEQATLQTRLTQARNSLPRGHPALSTLPHNLDDKGVPLWEREWNGGSGWKDGDDDGDDE